VTRCRSKQRPELHKHQLFTINPLITAGVGKTFVAQALGHLAIRRGADVRFTKTSRVLAELAGGHIDHSWTRRLRELARPALLILDDFGMRELTAAQARRPLRTDHRTDRALAGADLQPLPGRLVSAVSQPRGRRVAARPPDQHQPPDPDERPQLPTNKRPGRQPLPAKETTE